MKKNGQVQNQETVKDANNVDLKKTRRKIASVMESMGWIPGMPTGDVSRLPLMYIDPLMDPILLTFPKENVKALNTRLRHYYSYNPIIRSVIDLHASYALSDFELRCEDKEIENYYNDLRERLDLLTMMINLNRDFWLLGNAFMYGDWDNTNGEWVRFNQYPAENIEVHRSYMGGLPVYFLKADEEVKKILQSNSPADIAVAATIPDEFKAMISSGQPYQLANERLIHFANKPAQYTLLGESIVKSCLKDLLYEDKLRLLQFTYCDRGMHPIKHWKIGSESKGWLPSKKNFDETKALIMQGVNDPDYQLITHPFVSLDIKDQKGMWGDIDKEFEFVRKRIMIGLFCNDAMLGGEASPYAKDVVNMKVVMHRYMLNRNLLERLIREKVFLPVAIEHGLIKRTTAELKHNLRLSSSSNNYILPRFFYRERANLLSSQAEQQMILQLRKDKELPFEMVCDVFGWDPETIKARLNAEADTVLDPMYKAAKDDLAKQREVRDNILNGKYKNNDFSSLTELKESKNSKTGRESGGMGGRPSSPLGDLSMPDSAIIPNGPGDSSPRSKQEDMGTETAPSVPEGVADLLGGL